MKTPIYDFLASFAKGDPVRLHMPGHKGVGKLGERFDITEVSGADSLYGADGIIKESEDIASELFGSRTYYSTEGSSLSIRAMLHLAAVYARSRGIRPRVLAGRNAHKVFISAAALIDFDIEWLGCEESYLTCSVSAEDIRSRLSCSGEPVSAVYLTSPDYLGNTVNIKEIAEACHDFGVLLLVDNAHGAYLKFLPESLHPIDLGADMCADSAHKTLPVLTGGAYLHISNSLPTFFPENAKSALSLYGSTSPSYLILASLDLANNSISRERIAATCELARSLKERLFALGFELLGDEPLKITLCPKSYGYLGTELSALLEAEGIFPEFADPDNIVFMLSERTGERELSRLCEVLSALPRRSPIAECSPRLSLPERVMSPREAIYSPSESISLQEAEGRILAAVSVGCPPAVPIVVSGERIDRGAIRAMEYYGIERLSVVKEEL